MSTTTRKARAGKPVIAVSAIDGALEEFSSLAGAVVYLKSLNKACSEDGIRKACNGVNLKYIDRYWSFVE